MLSRLLGLPPHGAPTHPRPGATPPAGCRTRSTTSAAAGAHAAWCAAAASRSVGAGRRTHGPRRRLLRRRLLLLDRLLDRSQPRPGLFVTLEVLLDSPLALGHGRLIVRRRGLRAWRRAPVALELSLQGIEPRLVELRLAVVLRQQRAGGIFQCHLLVQRRGVGEGGGDAAPTVTCYLCYLGAGDSRCAQKE